jgi:peroxiredoxin
MENQSPQNEIPAPRMPGSTPTWLAKVMILCGVFLMILAVTGVLLQNRASSPEQVSTSQEEPAGPLRVGSLLADFTLPGLDGKQVKLSDYRGRMVLINAWATWCPPCQAEMPDLNALYEKHRSTGFVILAVNTGETRDQAAAFAKQLGLTFPILLDQDESLMDQLAIHDYPTSILVDGNGIIKAVKVGMFSPQTLNQEIAPFLK